MSRFPNTSAAVWPAISQGRFASNIQCDSLAGCRVALLGLPDDLGVKLNNGRPGAAQGPRAFRDALARYGVSDPVGWNWPKVFDAGDVLPSPGTDAAALTETHRRISESSKAIVQAGLFPIAIGGGHDLTFAFVRGVLDGLGLIGKAAGLYFDAHLDVRETAGSGMPFRKLCEECGVKRLHLHGYSPFVNSREQFAWFQSHGGRLDPLATDSDSIQVDPLPTGDLFVSFDLDVFDGGIAPGVSAQNPMGKNAAELMPHVRAAGASLRVRCFDIMELNPAVDEGGRTARLAAHVFLTFLRGLSDRSTWRTATS